MNKSTLVLPPSWQRFHHIYSSIYNIRCSTAAAAGDSTSAAISIQSLHGEIASTSLTSLILFVMEVVEWTVDGFEGWYSNVNALENDKCGRYSRSSRSSSLASAFAILKSLGLYHNCIPNSTYSSFEGIKITSHVFLYRTWFALFPLVFSSPSKLFTKKLISVWKKL